MIVCHFQKKTSWGDPSFQQFDLKRNKLCASSPWCVFASQLQSTCSSFWGSFTGNPSKKTWEGAKEGFGCQPGQRQLFWYWEVLPHWSLGCKLATTWTTIMQISLLALPLSIATKDSSLWLCGAGGGCRYHMQWYTLDTCVGLRLLMGK